MSNPLASIITPCLNGAAFVHRLLDSILAQTYSPIEFIFVNDGSTDRTEDIVFSYRERFEEKGVRLLYVSHENRGVCRAINSGLKLISGDYLSWIGADDWFAPTCVEKKVAYLEAHPDCGDVCVKVEQLTEKFRRLYIAENLNADNEEYFMSFVTFNRMFYMSLSHMIRVSFFRRYSPGGQIYDDFHDPNAQFLMPILYRHKLGKIDEVLAHRLVRKNSHSHAPRTFAVSRERWQLFEACIMKLLEDIITDDPRKLELLKAEMMFNITKARVKEARNHGQASAKREEIRNLWTHKDALDHLKNDASI